LKRKHIETLNELFAYLKIEKATYFVEEDHFIGKLTNTSRLELNTKELQDLIYIDNNNFVIHIIEKAFEQLKEDGVFIIENPYNNLLLWNKLKDNSNSQVIVDTYFFGFVFTKNTQAKEEFFIRL